MKRSLVTGLAVLVLIAAMSAKAEEMPLAAGAAYQFLWEKVQADPGRDVEGVEEFRTRRMRLYLEGDGGPRMDYGITLAYNEGDEFTTGVYEAWLRFKLFDWLFVKTGSFLPEWGLTMSRPVHSLDFIQYPLIIDNGLPLCTPWRQTGVMLEVRPGRSFTVFTGLFNGLDRAGHYNDDNNMKDAMVSLSYTAYPGVALYLGHWGGKSALSPALAADVGSSTVDYSNIWTAVTVEKGSWRLAGEVLWNRINSDSSTLRQSRGYHVSGVYLWNNLEALLRYEQFDPDTSDVGGGAGNKVEWTTLGLNYVPSEWAKLMVNYVFKSEYGDQRANEQMLFQVSISL